MNVFTPAKSYILSGLSRFILFTTARSSHLNGISSSILPPSVSTTTRFRMNPNAKALSPFTKTGRTSSSLASLSTANNWLISLAVNPSMLLRWVNTASTFVFTVSPFLFLISRFYISFGFSDLYYTLSFQIINKTPQPKEKLCCELVEKAATSVSFRRTLLPATDCVAFGRNLRLILPVAVNGRLAPAWIIHRDGFAYHSLIPKNNSLHNERGSI